MKTYILLASLCIATQSYSFFFFKKKSSPSTINPQTEQIKQFQEALKQARILSGKLPTTTTDAIMYEKLNRHLEEVEKKAPSLWKQDACSQYTSISVVSRTLEASHERLCDMVALSSFKASPKQQREYFKILEKHHRASKTVQQINMEQLRECTHVIQHKKSQQLLNLKTTKV